MKKIVIKKIDGKFYYTSSDGILIEVEHNFISKKGRKYLQFIDKVTRVVLYQVPDRRDRGIDNVPGVNRTNLSLDELIIKKGQRPYIPGRTHHNHKAVNERPSEIRRIYLETSFTLTFKTFVGFNYIAAYNLLYHYRYGQGRTLNVTNFLKRLIREDNQIRNLISNKIREERIAKTKNARRKDVSKEGRHRLEKIHGFFFLEQEYYSKKEFMYAFGGIDRFEWAVNFESKTVDIWFADNYEFHPVGKNYENHGTGDKKRPTNSSHKDMVELKSIGANDFWMKAKARFPLSLFDLSKNHTLYKSYSEIGLASRFSTLLK